MATRTSSSSAGTAAIWIIAVVATLFFLQSAKSLLIPIALALLISYALSPAVTWLEHLHIPRLAGAGLVLAVILGLCGAGGYALRDEAKGFARSVPDALNRARQMVSATLESGGPEVQEPIKGGGADEPQEGDGAGERAVGTSGQMAGSLIERAVTGVFSLAGQFVVTFFLIYFFLVSGHHVRNRLVEISGPDAERRRMTSTIIDNINTQIQRYLLILLVTAVTVGLATWAVLAWMGVEHAAMWAVLAGVFNSIPFFGPVVVSGGLFMVGLMQPGGITQALQMSGAAIVITSLEGWLLTPALMGKAERMSTLAVFLGLLLWTWVWGEWGTLLAVPMLVVIKSVADHVASLKPLGRLMAP